MGSHKTLQVRWLPGSDQLEGICHCAAAYVCEEPGEVWDWLLGHPAGHHVPTRESVPAPDLSASGVAR